MVTEWVVWVLTGACALVAAMIAAFFFSARRWVLPLSFSCALAGILTMYYGAFVEDRDQAVECQRLGGSWVAETGMGAVCVDSEGKVRPW